jgi:hypothetical protein
VIALLWANSPAAASYDTFWHTPFAVRFGSTELALDLQHWVNHGLMALFFYVVALEVKRELVIGEFAGRRQAAVPALAALTGLVVPALIYVAFNLGDEAVAGWGVVISTDTAFLLAEHRTHPEKGRTVFDERNQGSRLVLEPELVEQETRQAAQRSSVGHAAGWWRWREATWCEAPSESGGGVTRSTRCRLCAADAAWKAQIPQSGEPMPWHLTCREGRHCSFHQSRERRMV